MAANPARYALRWTNPSGARSERELEDGTLSIGRSSSNGLVLDSDRVSRIHANVEIDGERATIRDMGSRNGTYLAGDLVKVADLVPGEEIGIGPFTIEFVAIGPLAVAQTVVDFGGANSIVATEQEDVPETIAPQPGAPPPPVDVEQTIAPTPAYEDVAGTVMPDAPPSPVPDAAEHVQQVAVPVAPSPPLGRAIGNIPAELLASPVISEAALSRAGVEISTAEFVALGGGMGSFVFVDLLRNSGVPTSDILVVGNEAEPYGRYERLTRNSQIPRHERIRSNSESCPDNIWGFPGYAPREAWSALKHGKIADAIGPLWAVFGEPVVATTYTPQLSQVFGTMAREAKRIGWHDMHKRGRIRAVRKTEEGRLIAIVSGVGEGQPRHFAVAGRFLHLAVGYPAIELLPDLTKYRETYEKPATIGAAGQMPRVVAAYEAHDHVYAHLREKGGTVLLRGRGIVASRVIQRLYEERHNNKDITVVHLHRTRIVKGHRFGVSRRAVENQFEFQPFNWPKASWGGEYRDLLEKASDEERKRLLDAWGGTTTASRPDWKRIIRKGIEEGWYRPEFGVVRDVRPTADGGVSTVVNSRLAGGGSLELNADFVIDCTGLEASPERAPFIADLYSTYQLRHNVKHRLAVTNEFEVPELRHGSSSLWAAGALTLGGPHAGVNTFLALQYCAVTTTGALLREQAKGLRPLRGFYSFRQWTKWCQGKAP